ncbi:hypothetical protein [Tenacibaculum sp. IB213877]|uniref:hypothetical protein n=1 Tax=Tenacibaculum sp. IB213877 TaxID=3097351 RepID=UPI002A5B03AD|nr:hypothetical protein [Tenacibaculum sp. IB213877]MDY0780027.1 hypothetical protein [Tenacibaculum sp. IB213877]
MTIRGLHNLQILRGLTNNRSILSCTSDGSNVDLWNEDDGSGRQQWEFKQLENKQGVYNIIITQGVTGDNKYLSSNSDGSNVDLWHEDDGSGRQQWEVTLINNSSTCNTYLIRVHEGVSGNKRYLSCRADGTNVDLWNEDDGSGRQRWQIQDIWPTSK